MDTLLICQHDPVYTIGVRQDGFDEEVQRLKKLNLNCEYYKTSRGGLITFHGPGQLVCYPIINLAHFTKSLRWYIHQLEKCLIATCNRFNVTAKTTEHTGVWVHDEKIAAIGIHSSRWITLHGIALNCNVDLSWFDHIVPCGIHGKGVTSLTAICDREVTVDEAIEPFVESFCDEFDCRVVNRTIDYSASIL
ncbi:uncharacterized protein TRIADDRAFT_19748 [Trichoplax adhaerens]|uniref:Octanoyl-[acyl-carrier-protein]:protein N-octanoyltransferase LIPT2, mitochondrial n=1 Tax=Trichoplax adhaerens TaxID=10228 RepID=B3RLX6_TRIAD|nr:hypothetical protein TRIADDRAFT_19748 [Trichoplax adhaerens]EDV29600.1 hypothetical protein TRIADDRAFT_19748 [Trichoplax adhaerens]|eukprot:XP_002108802.1 hypothetical protein TRIADDRAFT_19748 [Trichoplax adhaerens]